MNKYSRNPYQPKNGWNIFYFNKNHDDIPWATKELDYDFKKFFSTFQKGKKVLDIGCGNGLHSFSIAKLGFKVIAIDISLSAIVCASNCYKQKKISFVQQDINSVKLRNRFDVACDRGCLHIIPFKKWRYYIHNVHRALKKEGLLLLKCFSNDESSSWGPYCISKSEIDSCFNQHFDLISTKKTLYAGNFDQLPKALFCILKRRDI